MSLTIQHSFLEQSLKANLDSAAHFKICGSELSIQRLILTAFRSGQERKCLMFSFSIEHLYKVSSIHNASRL